MKKIKVAIIGPTGMLGSMVYKTLKDHYSLVLVYRNNKKLEILNREYKQVSKCKKVKFDLTKLESDYHKGFSDIFSPEMNTLKKDIGYVDKVINCAGITKPNSLVDPQKTYFINSTLPHILSSLYGTKLIHITTDCVFNGKTGAPYDEKMPLSPNDLYGLSKAIGEPSRHSLILRTSIIGPEITGKYLLVEWLRKQNNKTVNGFIDHWWNGITTKTFADICIKLIENPHQFPKVGLYHIFSNTVTKYQMLVEIKKKYNINVQINKTKSDRPIDRRLSSHYPFVKKLKIPSFGKMILDL